jgi:tetratricopeptide (TPR) repeat protein
VFGTARAEIVKVQTIRSIRSAILIMRNVSIMSPCENPNPEADERASAGLRAFVHCFGLCLLVLVLFQPLVGQEPAPVGGRTAGELLAAGEKAFNGGDWPVASEAFLTFLADFGGLQGTEGAVNRVKPLLAICHVRMGRLEEAMPLLEESLKMPDLAPALRTDLVFFAGLSALRTGQPEVARTHLGAAFNDASMERSRRMEALILGGMSYVMEKNWKETIVFFEKYGAEIARYSPEAGARVRILQMHALMQEKRWDEVVAMAKVIHASLDQTRQVVTFSSMLIGLGDHFLGESEAHKAISILRMVPVKSEILRLQNARLAEAELDLGAAESGGNSVRTSQLRLAIDEMKRELEAFAQVPQFDSAARMRLAGAYFQLQRTREACLILDQMVRQMEPDALVESATASLLRGWMSLERYARAARTADLYVERCKNLPEKPNLPEVMFLKGQALEGLFRYKEASEVYLDAAATFPDHEIAPRAEFMAAYNILQLEDYALAGAMLDRQRKKLRKSDEMWPHVVFWRAMALYFNQQWEPFREVLEEYLAEVTGGGVSDEYVDDARFRIGYSYFSEAKYPEAIQLLRTFESEFPTSEWLPEVLLALGDALGAEGELEEADRVYARIVGDAPGFHDEGWMKRGNIRKATKDLAGMKRHYAEFLEKRPNSPRIAEGLQWLGWVAKQEGDIGEARRIYWDAIGKFGNDMVRPGLEDIFLALQSFYPAAERKELETRLGDLLAMAKDERKKRFATRLGWAMAQLHLSAKGESATLEQRIEKCRAELVALVPQIDPKETSPRILADVADALAESGDVSNAELFYDGLRKWWPRSPERDRAFAGLGFLAAKAGEEAKALELFDRYERTSIMPKTAPDENGVALVQGELGGKVAMARADLLARSKSDEALLILLAIQKSKSMPTRSRAEAFMKTAELHVSHKRYRESLPYFEQIYILFNRFPELVASAYYGRGRALEEMAMPDKAREVYSELANREDLAEFEPARLGAARARMLGGIIPPKEPEGGVIPPKEK